ncbi:MAG TPA: hypothetical protein VD966_04045, partial [Pyrinomonadaceae bacterium]|nr:hypothetical protein [Pyrinomonadaceae bacterium]
ALAIANAEVRWNDGGLSFRSGLMRERVIEKTVVVEKLAAPSEEQLKTMVEARVRERLEEALRQGQPEIIQASANGSQPIIKRETRRPSNLRRNQTQQSVPRLELPRDRQYVARDEENVPRLFDLLGDAN